MDCPTPPAAPVTIATCFILVHPFAENYRKFIMTYYFSFTLVCPRQK